MTTTERLRELERAATDVYERATRLEYDTGDGRAGDVRVWDKNTAGRCVAVFRGENAQPTADAYIATRNALPAMLAVIEAAEAEIRSAREFRSRLQEYSLSYLDAKGERSEDMERRLVGGYSKLKANTDAALAAFREVRE